MKQGRTLIDLATEVQRQRDAKRDFIASSSALTLRAPDDPKAKPEPVIELPGQGQFGITRHAKRQLAEKLGIPMPYFDRLAEKHHALLAENVNQLARREPTQTMVRILDGNVRAFLSDRYRPLDNYDLAEAVLPLVHERNLEVVSCEITETRLYIKALLPWLDRELPVPHGLKMGEGHNWFVRKIIGAITISNSEVGAGRVAVNPGIFERQCTNLAVFREESYGQMHVGKSKSNGDDDIREYLSDDTKRLEDAAVWSKIRDLVKATMDGRVYDNILKKLVEARGDPIEADPAKVVEVFAKKNGLTETERGGLLRHLVASGEMTRYGLQWGVTRLAQDAESYDRASELERLGGAVIELPKHDWQLLAKAS